MFSVNDTVILGATAYTYEGADEWGNACISDNKGTKHHVSHDVLVPAPKAAPRMTTGVVSYHGKAELREVMSTTAEDKARDHKRIETAIASEMDAMDALAYAEAETDEVRALEFLDNALWFAINAGSYRAKVRAMNGISHMSMVRTMRAVAA